MGEMSAVCIALFIICSLSCPRASYSLEPFQLICQCSRLSQPRAKHPQLRGVCSPQRRRVWVSTQGSEGPEDPMFPLRREQADHRPWSQDVGPAAVCPCQSPPQGLRSAPCPTASSSFVSGRTQTSDRRARHQVTVDPGHRSCD